MRPLAERHDDPEHLINDWLDVHKRIAASTRWLIELMMNDSEDMKSMKSAKKSIQKFYTFERNLISNAIETGIAEKKFKAANPGEMAMFASVHLDATIVHSIIEESTSIVKGVENFRKIFGNFPLA